MPSSDEILKELVACGVSPATILIFVKLLADSERIEAYRMRARERMRTVRERARTVVNSDEHTNGYTNLSFLKDRPPSVATSSVSPPPKKERVIKRGVGKIALPEDWKPKTSHFELAKRLHLWGASDVLERAEWFCDQAGSKAWRYADWDKTFNNCIRDKWGCKSK